MCSIDAGNIPYVLGWDSAMLKSLQLICGINDGRSLILLIKMEMSRLKHGKMKELHVRRHRSENLSFDFSVKVALRVLTANELAFQS
jgi:hypothetical protein